MLRISKISKLFKMCNRAFDTVGSCNCESVPTDKLIKKKHIRTAKTAEKIDKYLKSVPFASKLVTEIPEKHLHLKQGDCISSFYLIDDGVASKIACHIVKTLGNIENKLICETNAGFGFLTKRLLLKGAKVRIYETCPEFRKKLRIICQNNINRTELFTKDLYHLPTMSYIDKIDNGSRVQQFLNGIPTRLWSSDPAITVIGPMAKNNFISYLIRMVVHQTEIINFGRVEIFAIMKSINYQKLSSGPEMSCKFYTAFTILFQLFFDYTFMDTYDRKAFIPYETNRKMKEKESKVVDKVINRDGMCLVHMTLKKKLPTQKDKLLALHYFVMQGYGRGRKRIIPTLENWLPDCGFHLLTSTVLKRANINLSIFTEFRELKPKEILILFTTFSPREMTQNPNYNNSPFIALIESDLLKRETVETDSLQEQNQCEKPTIKNTEL